VLFQLLKKAQLLPTIEMNILQYINHLLDIGLKSNDEIPFKITKKEIEAGQIITNYDAIETKVYFLKSGIVQVSLLYNDDERILDFFFENCFLNSYTSFLTKQPSDVQLIALTKVELDVIDDADIQNAYKTSLLANQLGRLVTERLFINNTKREKDLLTKTAEQRYKELLQNRPDIVSLISINKIAKYLGIHPESLSRIRKSIGA
jgi:CRP-like cAMP-binding protein